MSSLPLFVLQRSPFVRRAAAALLLLAMAGAAAAERPKPSFIPPVPEVIIEGRYAAEPIFRVWSAADARAFATP